MKKTSLLLIIVLLISACANDETTQNLSHSATLDEFWVKPSFAKKYGLSPIGLIDSNDMNSMKPLTDGGLPNFNFITGWTSVSYERYGLE